MLRYIFKNSGITIYVYTEEEKMQLIREFHINHLGGYQGVSRTFNKLYVEYYWKGMRQQIEEFIKNFRHDKDIKPIYGYQKSPW